MLQKVLYIHPIKQGLKLSIVISFIGLPNSSLHTSNKTRIETYRWGLILQACPTVLYIHPIKQGLKRSLQLGCREC